MCLCNLHSYPNLQMYMNSYRMRGESRFPVNFLAFLLVALVFSAGSGSAYGWDTIKINQLGYYPDGPKLAVIPGEETVEFQIIDTAGGEVVFSGMSTVPAYWQYSDEQVMLADFSAFSQTGEFVVRVEGFEDSYPFRIAEDVFREVSRASIKALYFNRTSTALEETHAGQWARPAGHPDDVVYVHASAATDERPEGYVISGPKGWYDAGDYNKYVVNSGISTYTMMAAYEHFPDYFQSLSLNIPESGNQTPDLLDEIRWNLDWMITMQDPNDGGVYHKLTSKNFAPVVMPHQNVVDRYVVMKSTAATLNYAAVMAVASRVYEEYDPEFAAQALEVAEYAWQWAVENPQIYYQQPEDIHTGQYGDQNVQDEFDWAAAELYITTGNDAYWNARNFNTSENGVPAWPYTRPLAWVSLAHHLDHLTPAANQNLIESRIMNLGQELLQLHENSAYGHSMGMRGNQDFVWGSNSSGLNHSFMLLQAYRMSENQDYLDAALANFDYMLGRNATGYSFVTGYGSRVPMDPHHRQSAADNVTYPVPGFLVGGPHAGQQDGCSYPSDLPALSYLDDWCSYATNEVAINWNAPLVYVSAAMEYFYGGMFTSVLPEDQIPDRIHLHQNYPNPFNPVTQIRYELEHPGHVSLAVYDSLGRRVSVIKDGYQSAGSHHVSFSGDALASGVYMYRLSSGEFHITRKMVLLK